MTGFVRRMSKNEAVCEVPRVVLGLIYGSVSVFLPGNVARNNTSAEISFTDGSKVILHPLDYAFIQSDLVTFFFGRNMRVTEEQIRGHVERFWPDVVTGPVIPGAASELEDSEPIEFP